MRSYKGVNAETFYSDGSTDDDYLCDVIIGDDGLTVSYLYGTGVYHVWKGQEVGEGHFELTCPQTPGSKATLHLMPDGDQLEGSWIQNKTYGMWRIDLDEENRVK